jgi:hypothetical protein
VRPAIGEVITSAAAPRDIAGLGSAGSPTSLEGREQIFGATERIAECARKIDSTTI